MWTLLMIRGVGSAGEHYDDNDSDDNHYEDNDYLRNDDVRHSSNNQLAPRPF